jgi:hypothetical protein
MNTDEHGFKRSEYLRVKFVSGGRIRANNFLINTRNEFRAPASVSIYPCLSVFIRG